MINFLKTALNVIAAFIFIFISLPFFIVFIITVPLFAFLGLIADAFNER